MDDQGRAICHLTVKTGHWFSGKEVQIPMKQVDGAKHNNQQTQNESSTII
jgi:hypothetical protein